MSISTPTSIACVNVDTNIDIGYQSVSMLASISDINIDTNIFFIFFIFFHPIYYLRPFVLSLLAATQIRDHIAGSSPPLLTTVRALHFYREEISALSSLVDSRRIVLTHARRSQQLILFYFIFANKFKISPRRDSNSRINT